MFESVRLCAGRWYRLGEAFGGGSKSRVRSGESEDQLMNGAGSWFSLTDDGEEVEDSEDEVDAFCECPFR